MTTDTHRVVSIDPGVRKIGYAEWLNGRLRRAALAETNILSSGVLPTWLRDIDELVIERPQVYVAARSKGDPNDLITLALVAGEIAGLAYAGNAKLALTYCRPAEWKRQLPKAICHERVLMALSAPERDAITLPRAKKTRLDVLDAVGIGLYHLGRTRPC